MPPGCKRVSSEHEAILIQNTNVTVHQSPHIPAFFVGMVVGKNIL